MTLFERASTLVIGTFPVYLQDVSFHASQREEDVTHVQRLADAFSDSDLLRWAHPIELVLSQENEEWVRRLSTKGKVPPLPRNLELLCISGKHRVLAAQRYFEEHGNLDSWPAIIYKAEMLECSWLEVYMTEKNTPRYRLPTTQRDLLLGLDRMIDSNPDMNVYALVTKHGSDASAVESLHKSRLWPSLFRILENGFLSDIRKEVLVNWPTRYRMYQVSGVHLDKLVIHMMIDDGPVI